MNIKEWIANKFFCKKFHNERQMVYFELFNDVPMLVFADEKFRGMTHRQWFERAGIDFDTTIRGYIDKNKRRIFLYVGEKYDTPDVSVTNICKALAYKDVYVDEVCLGSIPSMWRTITGRPWKSRVVIRVGYSKSSDYIAVLQPYRTNC